MKKLIAVVVFTLTILQAGKLRSQTFNEIFKQKKTQKKYLLQQIAALQIYAEYAKKGYSIASQGISAVKDLTKGELDLHATYFSGLKSINPRIKTYSRITDIIVLELKVHSIYKGLLPGLVKSESFSKDELDYVKQVFDLLTSDCLALTQDLIDITTDGRVQLSDDQRLSRIDALYSCMEKNYVFAKKFSGGAQNLAAGRKNDLGDLGTLQKLYEIKD